MRRTQILNKLLTVTLIFSLAALFTACDTSSSGDSDNLDGELTVEMQGPPGTSFMFSYQTWDGEEFEVGASGRQIPESGVFTTDLDSGSYVGVEVRAEFMGDESPDAVLRLLNDEDIVGESDTPEEDGSLIVRVGDFSGS